MITRKVFYDTIRETLLHVTTQQQVTTIEAIFDYTEKLAKDLPTWTTYVPFDKGTGNLPYQWLAYILATAYHETAHTFRTDIREADWLSEEWRKYHLRYYPYYGRGLCQLTWTYNYRRWEQLLGIGLVASPDLALMPATSIEILIRGMIEGRFTGHRLNDYDTYSLADGKKDVVIDFDFVGARHIINGTDRAQLIAGYAKFFEDALMKAIAAPDNANGDAIYKGYEKPVPPSKGGS